MVSPYTPNLYSVCVLQLLLNAPRERASELRENLKTCYIYQQQKNELNVVMLYICDRYIQKSSQTYKVLDVKFTYYHIRYHTLKF